MTTTIEFAAVAIAAAEEVRAPRRPQDHGPMTADEFAAAKTHAAITKSYTDAYDGLCKRHGRGGYTATMG